MIVDHTEQPSFESKFLRELFRRRIGKSNFSLLTADPRPSHWLLRSPVSSFYQRLDFFGDCQSLGQNIEKTLPCKNVGVVVGQ